MLVWIDAWRFCSMWYHVLKDSVLFMQVDPYWHQPFLMPNSYKVAIRLPAFMFCLFKCCKQSAALLLLVVVDKN